MQLADALEPEQQPAEFVLPAKHALNGVEPLLENRLVGKWLAAAFVNFRPLGLAFMFGTMPRLKIAFRLRRQS